MSMPSHKPFKGEMKSPRGITSAIPIQSGGRISKTTTTLGSQWPKLTKGTQDDAAGNITSWLAPLQ